jgi:hypothetical protein
VRTLQPLETIAVPDAAPQPNEELRVSGLSLLFYDFYLLDRDGRGPGSVLLPVSCGEYGYGSLFDFSPDEQAAIAVHRYEDPITIPPVDLPNGSPAQGEATLFFQMACEQFLLATTVVNVDRHRKSFADAPRLQAQAPLMVDDILALIYALNDPRSPQFRSLSQQRRGALQACFGDHWCDPPNAAQSRKNVGVQVWDIDNKLRPSGREGGGLALAEQFCWELAAILDCNNEYVVRDGEWRARTPSQIQVLTTQGTSVFASHRVLTHRSVCVEISQVHKPNVTTRSVERLRHYGYDSTSLYLWGHLALQEFALGYFSHHLSEKLHEAASLHRSHSVQAGGRAALTTVGDMLDELTAIRAAVYHALDGVCRITEHMRERRHPDFFLQAVQDRELDTARLGVERKLRELSEGIAADAYQVHLGREQADLMRELGALTEAASSASERFSTLAYMVGAVQLVLLAGFIGEVVPWLGGHLAKGVIGGAIVAFALFAYFWTNHRSTRSPHQSRQYPRRTRRSTRPEL